MSEALAFVLMVIVSCGFTFIQRGKKKRLRMMAPLLQYAGKSLRRTMLKTETGSPSGAEDRSYGLAIS
jgi:hypothetical protein